LGDIWGVTVRYFQGLYDFVAGLLWIAKHFPDRDWNFSSAIGIAIEKLIRIDRTLIFIFQPDRDCIFLSRLWLRNFYQGLIEDHERGLSCCRGEAGHDLAGVLNKLQPHPD